MMREAQTPDPVSAGPVAGPRAISSIDRVGLTPAIGANQKAHAVGEEWRTLRQSDGTMGYVNLMHVSMVLNGADGSAVVVWARPRMTLDAKGAPMNEHTIAAAGMTVAEFLGIEAPPTL